MDSLKYDSGTAWEAEIKYSRAVQRGNLVAVSGTTSMDHYKLIGPNNAGEQARFIFKKIIHALGELGAKPADVIRTRMYIKNADDAAAVTKAHTEFFGEVRPATTLLIVAGFIDPSLLVEIEADAYIL